MIYVFLKVQSLNEKKQLMETVCGHTDAALLIETLNFDLCPDRSAWQVYPHPHTLTHTHTHTHTHTQLLILSSWDDLPQQITWWACDSVCVR